ncbi:MAG: hypothetical protein Solumvirus3_14 [Solumvirus sp.]|uniref:Uncharacterized protein n=1 Tax=Solumvirus sp. TaxID=2487773 RepID=A0A3G5AGM0_9VIRU|nr:MAG: hypothetical protein Solumvirus3_14 [Solumvirus sp.]
MTTRDSSIALSTELLTDICHIISQYDTSWNARTHYIDINCYGNGCNSDIIASSGAKDTSFAVTQSRSDGVHCVHCTGCKIIQISFHRIILPIDPTKLFDSKKQLPHLVMNCDGYKCRNDGWSYEDTGLWCYGCHGEYTRSLYFVEWMRSQIEEGRSNEEIIEDINNVRRHDD